MPLTTARISRMDMSTETNSQAEEEKPVAPDPVAEAAQPAEDSGDSQKQLHGKEKQRRASRVSRQNQRTLQQVTDRFAACGRCSYFWAGYRIILGEEALATACAQSESGWLNLMWNLQTSELVHKSYGVRLDISHFHYEGCCKECRRAFVYQAAEKEDEAGAFRIEISPRTAK